MSKCYIIKDDKLILRVFLQPGASSDEVVGVHGDSLKIRVKAPAFEGKANQALIKFLAQQFNVPSKNVILAKGKQSKYKQLVIHNVAKLPAWLVNNLEKRTVLH